MLQSPADRGRRFAVGRLSPATVVMDISALKSFPKLECKFAMSDRFEISMLKVEVYDVCKNRFFENQNKI